MLAVKPQTLLLIAAVGTIAVAPAIAGSHLWVVSEVFSNDDGSIQFVELFTAASGERNIANKKMTSLANADGFFTFPANLTDDTADKYILLATQSFADLPGAPTPDHIIPVNAFSPTATEKIQWHIYVPSILEWGDGQLPTDGIHSKVRGGTIEVNTPTNYSGVSGSVDASGSATPPAVPDGSNGSSPMIADRLDVTGNQISLQWDTATCSDNSSQMLIFGERSHLPSGTDPTFTVGGAICDVAGGSLNWTDVPDAVDGSGLLWWLMLVHNGIDEGSWGVDGAGAERSGSVASGSSGMCALTGKDVSNACGR